MPLKGEETVFFVTGVTKTSSEEGKCNQSVSPVDSMRYNKAAHGKDFPSAC
jgi:hypothetical protein